MTGSLATKLATSVLAVASTASLASNESLAQTPNETPLSGLSLPAHRGAAYQPNTQDGSTRFDRTFNESQIEQPAITDRIREKIIEVLRSSASLVAQNEVSDTLPHTQGSTEFSTLQDEKLVLEALEVIHDRVELAGRLELKDQIEKDDARIEELEKNIEKLVEEEKIRNFPWGGFLAGLSAAAGAGLLVGLGIYDCLRDFYHTSKAYLNRGKVVTLWDSFQSAVTIDPPSHGSTSFSYPRSVAEVAGNEVRGRFGRGEESEIGTYVNSFMNSELSGNLIDLCPVGALTSKPYAYKVRP